MSVVDSLQPGDLFRSVFERIPMGIAAFDREFRLIEANSTWIGFLEKYTKGRSQDAVPGASIRELSPEAGEALVALFARVLTGETIQLNAVRVENEGAVSFWDISLSPLVHEEAIVGIIDATTSATERVEASRLADERQLQFRQIFESTSDAVIINDPDSGVVVEANPAACAMHGYSREEFLGLHPTQFIDADSLPLFAQYVETTLHGGDFRCRANDVRKDGSRFPVDVVGTGVDYLGKRHMVAVIRDITEQLAAEEFAARQQLELARMVEERTHELTALLELSRSASSTLDLQELLGVVLDQLRVLVDYSGAGISIVEDGQLVQLVAKRDSDAAPVQPRMAFAIDTGNAISADLFAGRPVVIDDVRSEADRFAIAYRAGVGRRMDLMGHVASWLAVPLRLDGETFGMLIVSRRETAAFSARDVGIVDAVASHAAIAVENARLFEAAEQRSRELATILRGSEAVLSSLDSETVLEQLLDQLQEIVPYDGCSLLTAMDDGHVMIVASRAGRGFPSQDTRGLKFTQESSGVIWQTVSKRGVIIVADVRGEGEAAAAYRQSVGEHLDGVFRSVTSFLAVPLALPDRVFGILTVSSNRPNYFTEHMAGLASTIGNQAAIALSNARLFEEAEHRAREMETLSRIAGTLTYDQPRAETLNLLAQRVVDSLGVAACSITLLNDELQHRLSGSAALPIGFTDEMAAIVAAGAPSPTHAAMNRGRRIIIRGVRAIALADERFARIHHHFKAATWDTIVVTPLIFGGRGLGTIEVYYREGEEPDERQVKLLEAIADQAAVAVENARLFAETQQRLRTAEALSRAASSLTFEQSLESTLDQLAESVVGATRAVAATVILVDNADDSVRDIGTYGLPVGYRNAMRESWKGGARSESMYVYNKQKSAVFTHVRERILALPRPLPVHSYIKNAAWDTIASVPIVFRGKSRGAVNAFYLASTTPDDAELALLRSIADQAAVGVENASLFAEASQRLRELQALYEGDEQLHASLDTSVVLQSLVDVAVDIAGADKSLLVVVEPRTNTLRIQASRGFDEASLEIGRDALRSLTTAVLDRRTETLVVEDAAVDERSVRTVIEAAGIGSYLDIPVLVDGEVFGMFNVSFSRPRKFARSDSRLFEALSKRAGVAIENARLYERSQQAASLEERQRLARELHDSVSQALYGIALGARTARTLLERDPKAAAEPLDYVLSLAEAGLAELRALIFELRPESLETEGVVAAFEKQAAAIRARHGIEVVAALGMEPDVPFEVKEVVYRIGQEALHNTVKHARATQVELTLRLGSQGQSLQLVVSDNGLGFDPSGDFPGHLGLKSMAERARNIGGTFTITSADGSGTKVELDVPLKGFQ